MNKGMQDPSVRARMDNLGINLVGGTPQDFARHIAPRWTSGARSSARPASSRRPETGAIEERHDCAIAVSSRLHPRCSASRRRRRRASPSSTRARPSPFTSAMASAAATTCSPAPSPAHAAPHSRQPDDAAGEHAGREQHDPRQSSRQARAAGRHRDRRGQFRAGLRHAVRGRGVEGAVLTAPT